MTTASSTSAEREEAAGWAHKVARLVTEVFAPLPTVALLLVVIAVHATTSLVEALTWVVVTVALVSLVPLAYVLWGVRGRRLSDRHVGMREQRPHVLAIAIGSATLSLVLLGLGGAPRELFALVAAMIAGLISSLCVTLVWKISIHTAVVTGVVVVLTLVYGQWALALSPLIALVCWARVELRDHTIAQVIAGVCLGAVVAAVVFSVLR